MSMFDSFHPTPPPERDTFRFAEVTEVSPVRIRMDNDTEATPASPTVLGAGPIVVGDRVWVQFHGRQMIILGVVNATQA